MTIEERKSLEIYKNCKSTYNLPSISKEQLDLCNNGKCPEINFYTSNTVEDYIGMNAKFVLIDIWFDEFQQKLNKGD